MYISREQLEQRLNRTEVQIKERERKTRGTEKRLSHDDRVTIGVLSKIGTQKEIAELTGVSVQTISNVSRDLTSPTIGVDHQLREDVNNNQSIQEIGKQKLEDNKKIQEQLITNLAAALGHVANNLDNTDATEASRIAVDMSKILDRVNGGREDRKGNKTAIIINVPPMKEEKSYQTITV